MTRTIFAAVIATALSTSAAFANDWSGPYAGVSLNAGMFNSETTDHWCYVACDGASLAEFGAGAGIAGGYDVQMNEFVFGVVADYTFTNFETVNEHEDVTAPVNYTSYTESTWDGMLTLRARAGLAVDNTLVYATGGVAFVDVNYRHDYDAGPVAENEGFEPYSDIEVGFAAGAGVEHKFNDLYSVSAEYLYVGLQSSDGGEYYNDLDDLDSPSDGTADYRSSAHMLRLAVNYRF
ncbi:opacity protein-like surface antigen [Yoonia maricola]|uniref:Opacity protein-like surface antigen n=1 Tax=Yoonia maricola TaxID=420999 RepID=A0A2M8WQB6_9RHOB|nr:outer membrane beta-barrel protein [Yoonia maricola]PJI93128.1 opacity protein-like surface antigen [Yoonia maricola]